MQSEKEFAEVASLIGDKNRSVMLWHLLDGRAFTATELSVLADISSQNASNHLSLLVKANLLTVEKQGRHRYFRFANDEVAHVVESLASLGGPLKNTKKVIEEPEGIKYARTCYDHLAGKLAVDIAHAMIDRKILRLSSNQFVLTESGKEWFQLNGIKIVNLENSRRPVVRTCLDWSERKFHVAGGLGAALLKLMIDEDWIRRKRDSRELIITSKGTREIEKRFRISVSAL
jgi:DNA-binding transcriptional ArsR family regulator